MQFIDKPSVKHRQMYGKVAYLAPDDLAELLAMPVKQRHAKIKRLEPLLDKHIRKVKRRPICD